MRENPVEEAFVKASSPGSGNRFGTSVAVYGDTVAVGAYLEDSSAIGSNGDENNQDAFNSGAVYIFTRNEAGDWIQQAYLKASNTQARGSFGFRVALYENTLAVGAVGEASAAIGIDGDQTKGTVNNSGAVYIFKRNEENTWNQEAYIKSSNAEEQDWFGYSLGLSGNTLVVGAYLEDSIATGSNGDETDNTATDSGAAYVFTRNDANIWSQQAYLKASNTNIGDWFGDSVSIDGNTIVVGARNEASLTAGINGNESDNSIPRVGAAYVFTRNEKNIWNQQAYIKASNPSPGGLFGYRVSLSGNMLAVGAYGENSIASGINGDESIKGGSQIGAVYIFERDPSEIWSQQAYIKASNPDIGDQFGESVALHKNTLVVGAREESSIAAGIDGDQLNNSSSESGAAYLFVREAGIWSQSNYIKASNPGPDDLFGDAVAIHNGLVVIAAPPENSFELGPVNQIV